MTVTSFGLSTAVAVNSVDETIISSFFNGLTAGKLMHTGLLPENLSITTKEVYGPPLPPDWNR